jgi:putative ABC transport system permease protein
MKLTIAGVALGIAAALVLARFLSTLLFGVQSWDPVTFLAVPILLSSVALFAVWLPAARASRLDPMQALRTE